MTPSGDPTEHGGDQNPPQPPEPSHPEEHGGDQKPPESHPEEHGEDSKPPAVDPSHSEEGHEPDPPRPYPVPGGPPRPHNQAANDTPDPEPPVSLEPFLAPLDPNWQKPTVSPEIVNMVKDIEIPSVDNFQDQGLPYKDGKIYPAYIGKFEGFYASDLLLADGEELQPTSEKLSKVYHKVYEFNIPKYDKPKDTVPEKVEFAEVCYSRIKDLADNYGQIRIFDDKSLGLIFDNFMCKYVDTNEKLGQFTYRFKMLNPIYNKVGKWWLGDKGQPIMAVPNNMDSYDGEPVVPKSYDDYLTHTEANKKLIDEFHQIMSTSKDIENNAKLNELYAQTQVCTFDGRSNVMPGSDWYSSIYLDGRDMNRDRTPLEFMSPYNPDVLVPEAKLNEIAKEHPEVWKPMIFECRGYKSICVSVNGYIISAYQPAPNVFLPIHIYGVSDHRGPDGYDAAKSVIITVHNFNNNTEDRTKLWDAHGGGDLLTKDMVQEAYDFMLSGGERH